MQRKRRHQRIRAKIKGTAERPRLCVFRSHKHIYAQVIDDEKGHTLVAASDLEIKKPKIPETKQKTGTQKSETKKEFASKVKTAYQVGQLIAQKALKKKISQIVFDRGGYKYHGRVKALAEGAREGGLKF